MQRYFSHEQLDVYRVALRFASLGDTFLSEWPISWAVHDQFERAVESIVTNLARAARLRATPTGVYSLECSLGSVLECAACLDVASCRHLLDSSQLDAGKELLQHIACMEVGLRASWSNGAKEDSEPYGSDTQRYFAHESLEVYRCSLQIHESLDALWQSDKARSRHIRRIDELTTSLTVNIAEGNGRFSKLEHGKFLGVAEDAGIKLAAYLDLVAPAAGMRMDGVKSYLREVMAMLSGLRAYLE